MTRVFLLALWAGLAACNGDEAGGERALLTRENGIWHVDARIDGALSQEFVKAQQEGLFAENDTLIIRSPGGDSDHAIVIGNIVRARSMKVVVDDYCISACAQYIFLAADVKDIDRADLLIFHSSPAARMALFERAGVDRFSPDLVRFRLRESMFYSILEFDADRFYDDVINQLGLVCILRQQGLTVGQYETQIGARYLNQGVAYSKAILEEFGVKNIIGEMAENQQDIDQLLSRSGFQSQMKVRFATAMSYSSSRTVESCIT